MNVDFITAIKMYFANYANFKGRSTRAEYWWAMLFLFLVGCATSFVSQTLCSVVSLIFIVPSLAILTRRLHDIGRSGWWVLAFYAFVFVGFGILLATLGSAFLNAESDPVAAANAITNNIGYVSLSYVVMLVGAIWMLVWCVKKSGPDNQYGPNPYGEE
ncbi:MAG: DUF805 domain-containing protein [Muribaculaceae bacterium]|nr:DUF805 domain-containing protein [Muribaculaceae bacterium]